MLLAGHAARMSTPGGTGHARSTATSQPSSCPPSYRCPHPPQDEKQAVASMPPERGGALLQYTARSRRTSAHPPTRGRKVDDRVDARKLLEQEQRHAGERRAAAQHLAPGGLAAAAALAVLACSARRAGGGSSGWACELSGAGPAAGEHALCRDASRGRPGAPRQPRAPAPSCAAAASSPHSFCATSAASRRRPLSTSQVGDSGQMSMPGQGKEHCSAPQAQACNQSIWLTQRHGRCSSRSTGAVPARNAAAGARTEAQQRGGRGGQPKHGAPGGAGQGHVDQQGRQDAHADHELRLGGEWKRMGLLGSFNE